MLYKRDCINKGGQEIAAHYNYHTHCFTCHKSSSKTKRYVCRLALPSRRSDKTKMVQLVEKPISDGKVRVVEQSPPGSIDSPPVSGQNTLDARDPRALALVLRGDQESDGLQVETSLPMSNVLRCNIAAKPLGALSQALNAHHYLTNYFSKKTFDLANTLSLVRTAQVEAVKYPSEADDAGTEIRKTKHLLTKVVNKLSGSIEISDTQASMALLNYESYVSTHSFWFVYIWPALRFQMQLARDRGDVVAPLEIDASEDHGDDSDDSDDEGDEDDAVEGLMEDRARLEDDRGYDNRDVFVPYQAMNRIVVCSQHDHYRWRAETPESPLLLLNLKEWCEMMRVVPRKDRSDKKSSRGRRPNATYLFNKAHPLHETHCQQVCSSPALALLAGSRRPPPPGPMPDRICDVVGYARWLKKANTFAWYAGTLLVPWEFDGTCRVSDWSSLEIVAANWRDPLYPLRYCIKEGRRSYLNRIGEQLRVETSTRKMLNTHRFEFAKRFNNVDRARMANTDGSTEAVQKQRILLAKAIDAIQQEADVGIHGSCKKSALVRQAYNA